MRVAYRDSKAYRKCATCDNKVLPPRRKCNSCRMSKSYVVTELRPSRKGMNARGVALHRPTKSHTKRAKRQNAYVLGAEPIMPMNARIMQGRQ